MSGSHNLIAEGEKKKLFWRTEWESCFGWDSAPHSVFNRKKVGSHEFVLLVEFFVK